MARLTIEVEQDVLHAARAHAVELGMTLNDVLLNRLREFAEEARGADGIREFLELARGRAGSSDTGARTWAREDLYGDRLGGADS